MKDNFSDQSKAYALFRPHYPGLVFDHILSFVKEKNTAWDCGTGNGQVAGVLSGYFGNVFATDISQSQIDQAIQKPNIHYSVQPAEQTSFTTAQFDLITVAQAIHWFRLDAFYKEVIRTARPDAIIAVIGYGLLQTEMPVQAVIDQFYKHTIAPYWDAERHYIDEAYQTIPFPFKEISMPAFTMQYEWTFDQLTGYLNTWSAVKHYIQRHQENPVHALTKKLETAWKGAATNMFSFPLLLRVGIVN